MPYTPDATDVANPTDAATKAATAALEFRTIKTYMRDVLLALANAAAPKNSPVFTGIPEAPTASVGTGTTQIATTKFVMDTSLTPAIPGQLGNSGRRFATDGTTASWEDAIPAATAAGTVDAITAVFTPAIQLTDKVTCSVVCAGANTSTTPTFAPDGLAAHTITMQGGLALTAGSIGAAGFVAMLQYNLANTRWELLNPVAKSTGIGGTTTTTSVTLTAASAAAITVTPATPGLYATLPDATTCTKADNLFAIFNSGDHDYGIKDSTGAVIGWVMPNTGVLIGLSDNATAAGIWVIPGIEKLGVTAKFNQYSATAFGFLTKAIALDANRTALLLNGTDCYVICYDASTQTWGALTLVRAAVWQRQAILQATDQLLVCTCNTTAFEAVTITFSGTTPIVNSGTKATATLAGNIDSIGELVSIPAQSAFALAYGRATNVSAVRALTVTGTTPTIGAEAILSPAVQTSPLLFVSGSILRTLAASSSLLYCKPFTVAGSTLSAGTQATTATTVASLRAILAGSGNIVAQYVNTTHYAAIFKLTGTTEAVSAVAITTGGTADAIYQITATKTAAFSKSGATWYANILTDTAGTASAGTEISGTLPSTLGIIHPIRLTGTSLTVSMQTSNSYDALLTFDCSGASAVFSSVITRTNATSVLTALVGTQTSYGRNHEMLLTAGSSDYVVPASGLFQADTKITATSFILLPNSVSKRGIPRDFNICANYARQAEAWYSSTLGNSNNGSIIVKVEAAQ